MRAQLQMYAKEEYIQIPVMRKLFKEMKIQFPNIKTDYINKICEYMEENSQDRQHILEWLEKTIKEGTKQMSFTKILNVEKYRNNPVLVKNIIEETFPDCKNDRLVEYKNTGERKLVNYGIIQDEMGNINKVNLTFSSMLLCGKLGDFGDYIPYPVFVEIYFDSGFIVARSKAKSTTYAYDTDNTYINRESKIDIDKYQRDILNDVIQIFNFDVESDKSVMKHRIARMIYNIYQEFSYTPKEIDIQVNKWRNEAENIIKNMFDSFHIDYREYNSAVEDLLILLEKYLSIQDDKEELFKVERKAYIIKLISDNIQESTKISTSSSKTKPLQNTSIFFDSKKYMEHIGQIPTAQFVFNRQDERYFKDNPLVVEFRYKDCYGVAKTLQYAEEVDIQDVLQTIFKHY